MMATAQAMDFLDSALIINMEHVMEVQDAELRPKLQASEFACS